jgi:predicted 3-demethylubiquinone-9 3-methyltransferase (glyoxalase superfamily)
MMAGGQIDTTAPLLAKGYIMSAVSTVLIINGRAQEAADFYTSIVKNSAVTGHLTVSGNVMGVYFTLDGHEFMALNEGPADEFNMSASVYVSCADQTEVDRLWDAITEEGEGGPCGWAQDKFGLWWQIVPEAMMSLVGGPDEERAGRAFGAMCQMSKIDLAAVQKAYDGA